MPIENGLDTLCFLVSLIYVLPSSFRGSLLTFLLLTVYFSSEGKVIYVSRCIIMVYGWDFGGLFSSYNILLLFSFILSFFFLLLYLFPFFSSFLLLFFYSSSILLLFFFYSYSHLVIFLT